MGIKLKSKMYYVERTRKYNNESQTYNGYTYQSKFEAGYAKDLDIRLKAKDIKAWRRQVKMDLRVNGMHITNYYVDFEITNNDGSLEYIEIKGMETEVWRLKRLLFEATYLKENPDWVYRVIKKKETYKSFLKNLPKGVKIKSVF